MLAVAIIVFREVLEAALIVSIVMAASLGIAKRNLSISGGVAGGVLGAGLVAMFSLHFGGVLRRRARNTQRRHPVIRRCHAGLAQPLDGTTRSRDGAAR